ncbi:MAG: hypothetical protein FWD94_02820 [Treponema sp.]|nr:hypothetical protein [Treponema sp.]
MSIAAFVADQMGRYVAGGMSPENAERFTMGELRAMYEGNHYGRDDAGKPVRTAPPEEVDTEAAMREGEAAARNFTASLTTGTIPAPNVRAAQRTGLEALKEYVRRTA